MIYSMTGYANRQILLANTTLNIEIKSVNHRFLDLTIKCPEEMRQIEYLFREKINSKIPRGKVELKISIKDSSSTNFSLNLNEEAFNKYIDIAKKIQTQIPDIKQASIVEVLNINGMIMHDSIEMEKIQAVLLTEISQLITDLELSQATEGSKLANVILEKISKIEKIIESTINLLPKILISHKEKLHQKLIEALGEITVNEQRFSQEFVYFCQKIDVDEELDRLNSHIKQFKEILAKGGAVGKKIDFITQEMHREANTLGSKSVAIDTTQSAIELKVLIEQIREQVQNIA